MVLIFCLRDSGEAEATTPVPLRAPYRHRAEHSKTSRPGMPLRQDHNAHPPDPTHPTAGTLATQTPHFGPLNFRPHFGLQNFRPPRNLRPQNSPLWSPKPAPLGKTPLYIVYWLNCVRTCVSVFESPYGHLCGNEACTEAALMVAEPRALCP